MIGRYTITAEDAADITGPTPGRLCRKGAARSSSATPRVAEKLAEHFHMDIDLLKELNPAPSSCPARRSQVAAYGPDREGAEVARIEADKGLRQVRAYDADG